MAKNIRKFKLESEFVSVYNGDEYIEPWVSYVEETSGMAYNKAYLKEIEIKNLKMVGNVPASGATVNKDNCTYVVYAVYSNYSREDITAQAEVTGSLVVEASQIEQSHLAGVLTLTATYLGKEASASVKVYQEAFVPSITAITIDNLTWNVDIPSNGGTASKDNCTYSVTAHWNIKGMTEDVTELASVTGSLVVEASQEAERHAAGTLTLTAEYSGLTGSADIAIYQEACPNYLRFNILSGGNIAFGDLPLGTTVTPLTIEYKKNDGEWTSLTSAVPDESTKPKTHEDLVNAFSSKFSVNAGDVVMFRGDNQTYVFPDSAEFNVFLSTASFNAEGNIMSLIDKNNFDSLKELTTPGTFSMLFSGCHGLISAENLLLPATALTDGCYYGMFYDYISDAVGFDYVMSLTTAPSVLPATTLADNCYNQMFQRCTSLITAPELPATTMAASACTSMFQGCTNLTTVPPIGNSATTMANFCCYAMFKGCTSLTTAPELPATTLASYCYGQMFLGCTSLITAPSVLPATTLTEACYIYMFDGCTSLTTAPELPATTLATNCYYSMFQGCTNLTTAPELPATTLKYQCYGSMFSGCSSLNYIKCLATNISASNCTHNWVVGVAASGTFVKNASMSSWTTGTYGIPSGWSVQDAS